MQSTIPNKAFDLEYSTQFRKEYEYLLEYGIRPSYVTKTKRYNITIYKYTKTPQLFSQLAIFYEDERMLNKFKQLLSEASSIEDIDLSILKDGRRTIAGCRSSDRRCYYHASKN